MVMENLFCKYRLNKYYKDLIFDWELDHLISSYTKLRWCICIVVYHLKSAWIERELAQGTGQNQFYVIWL